jgi:hypothetical protein
MLTSIWKIFQDIKLFIVRTAEQELHLSYNLILEAPLMKLQPHVCAGNFHMKSSAPPGQGKSVVTQKINLKGF